MSSIICQYFLQWRPNKQRDQKKTSSSLVAKLLSGVGPFKSRISSRDSVGYWGGDHHGLVSLSTRQPVISEMVTPPGAKSTQPQKKYLHWGIAARSTSRQKIHCALRSDSRYGQVLAVSSKRRCHELNSGLNWVLISLRACLSWNGQWGQVQWILFFVVLQVDFQNPCFFVPQITTTRKFPRFFNSLLEDVRFEKSYIS